MTLESERDALEQFKSNVEKAFNKLLSDLDAATTKAPFWTDPSALEDMRGWVQDCKSDFTWTASKSEAKRLEEEEATQGMRETASDRAWHMGRVL